MIIFGIFLIIIAVSFILAYYSMRDFQEIPSPEKNGIYLIQSPNAFTTDLIAELCNKMNGEVVSVERLFKGTQSALIIFGSKQILEAFPALNLLELEDYTGITTAKLSWEMGVKDSLKDIGNIFEGIPNLYTNEQFWWQLVLQPEKGSRDWQAQIRAVLLSDDQSRQKQLSFSLQKLSKLVKIPRPLTSDQIYQAYVHRAYVVSSKPMSVGSEDILKLVGRE
jgi:hypothetical protein